MATSGRLSSCLDEDGNVDSLRYINYRRRLREESEDEDDVVEQVKKKRDFAHRDYDGYDPNDALSSEWYKRYVLEFRKHKNRRHSEKFRRRFRMPYTSFSELVDTARTDNWFPSYEKCNALGQKGVPLEILILGALRYLGRGWTYDDISERTGVSEEVHRIFFKAFVKAVRNHMYPVWVKRPETDEEIADCMSEFTEAGFNGCIGSADVTRVIIEKCHARLKNQNLGGKDSHTTRAFQIVMNHRRQILASTVGYPGRWNDKTIVRFDGFVTDIQRGLYLQDNIFTLDDSKGKETEYTGAWVLVDGGYLNWSSLICPFKDSISKKEARWSRWAESMRKDVECVFGILKGNFISSYLQIDIESFNN